MDTICDLEFTANAKQITNRRYLTFINRGWDLEKLEMKYHRLLLQNNHMLHLAY